MSELNSDLPPLSGNDPQSLPFLTRLVDIFLRGDVAILFTDGITESRNKGGEDFTEERLLRLSKKHVKLAAQSILDKIYKDVEGFTEGTAQMDDMTLVIIKRIA